MFFIEWCGDVLEHASHERDVLLFELAHPPVVADGADGLNLLFGVIEDYFRAAAYLVPKRPEILPFVNPGGPEMLPAPGAVIAE